MATAKPRMTVKYPDSGKTDDFKLHLIHDRKTEMYVKFGKVMIMFQGAYSEERSRWQKELQRLFKNASQMVSDETYREHRKTTCSYERTEEFYDYFQVQTVRALEEGNNLVILDPTMSSIEQNRYYLALAYKMQYVFLVCPPVVCPPVGPGSKDVAWPHKSQAFSFRECGSAVPYSNMFKHLFCAWYLHDIDSLELRNVAKLYVQDCLEKIPEFGNLFRRICPDMSLNDEECPSDEEECTLDEYRQKCKNKLGSGGSHGKNTSGKNKPDVQSARCTPDSFSQHFKLEEKRQDLAYCVVKIFQGMKDMNDYFKESTVASNYGRMSKLLVAGFVVSPHVVVARVKLTAKQKEMWKMPEEIDENTGMDLKCASELLEESKSNLPDVKVRLISSKSNQTLSDSNMTVYEPMDAIPSHVRGRSCHIVLGTAPGAPKRNIDYDVAFALKRDRTVKEDAEIIDLERCMVKRLGKYWLIYLKNMYTVDGFFASCCKPFAYETAIV